MKSSFLPKYEQKIVRISALTTQGRNPDSFTFLFWEKRWLHKFILKISELYDFKCILFLKSRPTHIFKVNSLIEWTLNRWLPTMVLSSKQLHQDNVFQLQLLGLSQLVQIVVLKCLLQHIWGDFTDYCRYPWIYVNHQYICILN